MPFTFVFFVHTISEKMIGDAVDERKRGQKNQVSPKINTGGVCPPIGSDSLYGEPLGEQQNRAEPIG